MTWALESLKTFHFNRLFLSKVYIVWAKKVHRSYLCDLWFEKSLEKYGKFSPEHFVSNFGGWSLSFALSNWDWKNKNIYLKINIFILTFSLTRHSLGYSDQCCHYTETSPLIYRANQWDGFNTIARLDWKVFFNVKHHLFFIYFLLSWRKSSPLFLSVQPNHLFYTKA